MEITVDTRLIGLLGTPIGHSISSRMHNDTFNVLGLDYCYLPVEVGSEHLGDVVNGLKYLNFRGFGVTRPHKIDIMRYLDEMDELAGMMGSCNTVVNNDGFLKGYNTDGDGFVRSLLNESNIKLKDATIFCFGAGGTARACCFALANRGVKKIYISSNSGISCETLANEINSRIGLVAESVRAADRGSYLEKISGSDVLLNMTGLGMHQCADETPIEKEMLDPGQICYDATYNPPKTRFLREAESIGCHIINGLGMLVNQGAMQFKLWTGEPEPYAIMEDVVKKMMK
ncbi:MAG: shikimate dehydrogenase [Clostridiaceae bacterium]